MTRHDRLGIDLLGLVQGDEVADDVVNGVRRMVDARHADLELVQGAVLQHASDPVLCDRVGFPLLLVVHTILRDNSVLLAHISFVNHKTIMARAPAASSKKSRRSHKKRTLAGYIRRSVHQKNGSRRITIEAVDRLDNLAETFMQRLFEIAKELARYDGAKTLTKSIMQRATLIMLGDDMGKQVNKYVDEQTVKTKSGESATQTA